MLGACGGSSSSGGGGTGTPTTPPPVVTGPTAEAVALAATAGGETCALCHTGTTPVARSGSKHQEIYSEFYQDGVVKIVANSMNLNIASPTLTLTFKMTKNGANFSCLDADSIGSYLASYDPATKTFPSDLSLKPTTTGTSPNGTIVYDGAGGCTYTKTFTSAADLATIAGIGANYIVQIYGVDEILETNAAKHISSGKYPFAGVLKVGTVDYSTAANVTGCENCHTQPFLKHTYIYGTVAENATGTPTEFYTCKGCHYDERNGGHQFWQILKDDPARAAEVNDGSPLTDAEKTKYAYKAKLMNDVHMSHAMEFAYPQSMKNCVTCHANKMDTTAGATTGIFRQATFAAETCISCHSVDGISAKMTAAAFPHAAYITDTATLKATDCTICHKAAASGGIAPTLAALHNGGYDPQIYSSTGVRYSSTFVVATPTVTIANNVLDIKFTATGTLGSLSAANITPTVLVGLYGYDSKDFLVSPHDRDADRIRLLEYKWGDTNPRFTQVSGAGGSWEVKADLSNWADQIADGSIKRAEIAVLPELKDAAGTILGLNAPSVTFNLDGVTDDSAFFSDIVKVAKTTGADGKITGCNTCHDQLATTFHSGIRGGNIKVCRLCHTVANGGSHLELQSRSIDSYVHAIHSFQVFDIGDLNLADPVQALEHEHHIETDFPRFGITNCESCHNPGKYDVPDQSKSMPGVLSGTDAVAGRSIGTIPATVTGPATRACGGCHRAQKINADDAGGLLTLIQHWKQNGYVLDDIDTLWEATVAAIMGNFK